MFRFGLENMRRLRHVPPIEIRPITLLVGKNSSGKSTFLRTFPLLRQSLMTRTSSPILWYGDLVDFGDFHSVISDGRAKTISLSFGVDGYISGRGFSPQERFQPRRRVRHPVDVKLTMAEEEGKVSLNHLSFTYDKGESRFDVHLDAEGDLTKLQFNETDVSSVLSEAVVNFKPGSFLPEMSIRLAGNDKDGYYFDETILFRTNFRNLVAPHVNKRMGEHQLEMFAYIFLELSDLSDASLQDLASKMNAKGLKRIIEDIRGKDTFRLRQRLFQLHHVYRFIRIVPAVFTELRAILSTTLYIGPMRARSERYYRYQDLAVSEIDPDGKNFPMFLNSLNDELREDFSTWVADRFGYGVEVEQRSGHISINLKVGNYTTNIVDNGYGISQILPVLGQIWWASTGVGGRTSQTRRGQGSILVIEQPELHLHPAHQALIADAIVAERGNKGGGAPSPVQFIIETHSEALVNRLGELVALGQIEPEDVQILIFEGEDDPTERLTNVRLAHFDDEGTLTNWPYGFFEPSV
ncbi:DUF3696 domain-containing protein [Rhizobium sp. YAF28]|uniref:DUF3696 domain-containing protein n=1 Tax=Rhizobium sp. YAF28 TaxID=3233081 RepID=UPI003F964826